MTATHVNGCEVIASEPVASPLSTPDRPVYFRQIRRLLLADDSEAFGCVHCDYTASAPGRVRAHLSKHNGSAGTGRQAAGQINLDELLARIARGDAAQAQLDAVTKERNTWKRRALAAERNLAAIRRAVTGK